MFFKKRLNKKGAVSQQLTNVIKDLILVLIVAIALLTYIHQTVNDKRFEMAYLARDISLLETAVYASPHDVTVEYSSDTDDYTYDFNKNNVKIYEKGEIQEANKIGYHVSADKLIKTKPTVIEEESFVFKKTPNSLIIK